MRASPTPLAAGFVFGEAPRWRGERLYFSDMHGEAVYSVDLAGDLQTVVELPGRRPSGLGFLPDGTLLIVSMVERQLLRWDGHTVELHVDLGALIDLGCNDMIVDAHGRAYVGAYPDPGAPRGPLALVELDGTARIVAEDLEYPNGIAISADGTTLVVAESLGRRLTAFDVDADGGLTGRRTLAECPGRGPDGICLDEHGAVWAAMTLAREFQRVLPGGEVSERVGVDDRLAIACCLGGPERKTLFLLTALEHDPAALQGTRDARIDVVEVGVPGAGQP